MRLSSLNSFLLLVLLAFASACATTSSDRSVRRPPTADVEIYSDPASTSRRGPTNPSFVREFDADRVVELSSQAWKAGRRAKFLVEFEWLMESDSELNGVQHPLSRQILLRSLRDSLTQLAWMKHYAQRNPSVARSKTKSNSDALALELPWISTAYPSAGLSGKTLDTIEAFLEYSLEVQTYFELKP